MHNDYLTLFSVVINYDKKVTNTIGCFHITKLNASIDLCGRGKEGGDIILVFWNLDET